MAESTKSTGASTFLAQFSEGGVAAIGQNPPAIVRRVLADADLTQPDGRPLYRYSISPPLIEELERALPLRLAPGRHHVPSSAAFVLWASEYVRSRFRGGALSWEFVFNGLGLTQDRDAGIEWVDAGMNFWRRPIRRFRGGHRMFLYSLMAEGGLPESLVKQEGLYRRVVLGMLADIEAEGGTQAALFTERIAARWVALLPQTFQTVEFAHLMKEFVLALVALREQLPPDLPEVAADRWLDLNRPGWKACVPVRLSDDILNNLIRPALRSQRDGAGPAGGPLATRELHQDKNGIWHSVLRLVEGGFLSEALLPGASGLRLRLLPTGATAYGAAPPVYTAAPDVGGWQLRRFGRSGNVTIPLPMHVPLVFGAFADGRPQGEVIIAPELPPPADAPSLWRAAEPADGEASHRLLPQAGSGRARATCLWLLVAESLVPVPDTGLVVEHAGAVAGCLLWRLAGQGVLRLGSHQSLRIETSAQTEAPEAHLVAVGQTLRRWRTLPDRGLIYSGAPTLFGEIAVAGLKPLTERNLRIDASSGRVLGAQLAKWVEQDEVRARLRFVSLPSSARLSVLEEGPGRVRIEVGGLPSELRLVLSAGAQDQRVELPDGAGHGTLFVNGSPPGELTVRLSHPGKGTALELVTPWPARAGLILSHDGRRLERDTKLAVEELLGWRALIPDGASGDLELQLVGNKAVALPVAGELPLYPFAPLIRAMLAHGGPDAQVNLRLVVAGQATNRIELRRYNDHAMVEGDRLRARLPRDTRLPPVNAFSAQFDRRPISLYAVSLNSPENPIKVENTTERDLRKLLGEVGGPWLVQSRIDGRPQRAVTWAPSPPLRSTRSGRIYDYSRSWQRLLETPDDIDWERNWTLIAHLAHGGDPGIADQVQALALVPAAAVALLLRVPLAVLAEALALDVAAPIFWPTVAIADFTLAINVELKRSEARYTKILDLTEAIGEARNYLVCRIADVLLLLPALAGHFAASLAQAGFPELAVELNARGKAKVLFPNPDAELKELAQVAARRFDRLPSGVGRVSPRTPPIRLAFNRYAQPVIDAPVVAAEFALGQRGQPSTADLLDIINLRLVDPLYFDAALPVAIACAFMDTDR